MCFFTFLNSSSSYLFLLGNIMSTRILSKRCQILSNDVPDERKSYFFKESKLNPKRFYNNKNNCIKKTILMEKMLKLGKHKLTSD